MKRNERSSFKWQQKQLDKHRQRARKQERNNGGFRCTHCKWWVPTNEHIGTSNRNHCNFCLWSRHVDERKGDRKATCKAGMKPIALTFKHEGYLKQGELMLVHQCTGCNKYSINRIARDDPEDGILALFEASLTSPLLKKQLAVHNISILTGEDRKDIIIQLFGKN